MSDAADEFLAHFGKKGMKWGVRHEVGSDGRVTAAPRKVKAEPSEDHTAVETLRKKSTPALSNTELKKINERLQLEKTYKELSQSKSTIDKGQKKVDRVLKTANTAQQVYTLYNSPMVKALIKQFGGVK
jgi:hypothetical protein